MTATLQISEINNLIACRVCLTVDEDRKMFNIFNSSQYEAYCAFSGDRLDPKDGLPQQMCYLCIRLLQKLSGFQELCQRSQLYLKEISLMKSCQGSELTNEDIIQLSSSNSFLRLSIHTFNVTVGDEVDDDAKYKYETDIKCEPTKEEPSDHDDNISGDLVPEYENESSDEEPLVNKVKHGASKDLADVKVTPNSDDEERYPKEIEDRDLNNTLELINMELVLLTKEEQLEEVLKRKSSSNYLNSFYKCDKCYRGFIIDATFKNHMARHEPSVGEFECEICHFRWANSRSLRMHTLSAHRRKYICKTCGYGVKSLHHAREHCNWHKGHVYVCKECGKSFRKPTSLLTHVRVRHPSKYTCDVCGEAFIGEFGLFMHKKKAHINGKELPVITKYTCDVCKARFSTASALERHACDERIKHCPLCGQGFVDTHSLREHTRSHRNGAYACDQCSKSFDTERRLAAHRYRMHLGGSACGRRDASSTHGAGVVCETCGRRCNTRAALVCHQRTHTGEKPFQCTECPKKFSIYQRLQIHTRTHTGERPFKCTTCTKAFKHKAALNRHVRVHTGAKPYACQYCGKCFSQSNSMKTHVLTVHLKQPAPYKGKRQNKTND